jgi:nitroreductase
MSPQEVNQLIRERRSIFPKTYISKEIPKDIILNILENANWAPTHKLTEPWRFKVLTGEILSKLSEWQVNWYKTNVPEEKFSERKLKKLATNPQKAGAIIAICMQRDPKAQIPEWEEVAAVACAVQNMWLTATSYDIGAYWSSPGFIKDIGPFLNLEDGESCLGFFYMGYHNTPKFNASRKPIEEKVVWL